jgi:hypothetical protein
MNIFRIGARIISRSSPALLLAGGAVLALTLVPVRHGLRTVAVKATKGALIVGDGVKNLTAKLRAEATDIVAEARQTSQCSCSDDSLKSLRSCAKVKGRRMAVATTVGVLNMKEKAKSIRDGFTEIVEEAKELRTTDPLVDAGLSGAELTSSEGIGIEIPQDGLEVPLGEIGPDAPRKRRTTSKKNND